MKKIQVFKLKIRGIDFLFHKDINCKYNFLNSALLDFFKGVNAPTPIEERMPQDQYDYLLKNAPFDAPLYYDKEVYSFVGVKWVWRRGILNRFKVIRLNFEYENRCFNEEYLIDRSLADKSIAGVLGRRFHLLKTDN